MTASHNLKTTTVTNDKGACLLIGEHPDSVFVGMDIDGKVRGSFFTDEQMFEAIAAMWAIRKRRLAAKAAQSPETRGR